MTTDEIELKALMLASLDGDAASHRALLERLSRRLRAYYKGKLSGIGRGASEAEDLVQDALLAIHIKRHTYNPAEPLTPWVYAIARYKLIDFLRRTRTSRADIPIEEADNVMAHDDSVGAESTYDLKRLMQQLPKNMRCSIEAVKLDGQSVASRAPTLTTPYLKHWPSCISKERARPAEARISTLASGCRNPSRPNCARRGGRRTCMSSKARRRRLAAVRC
jgi:RNA polymerase sigma-70 factor (ECF subfamily)